MTETALPQAAEIVVIGGGIVGCSTAYHLARDHRADVVVLEQGRLTGGSTWHAAGLVGQLRTSAAITELLKYSVELYDRLEAETGLATGWKRNGGLRLAATDDRWIELKRQATTARSFGLEMHLLSPQEAKSLWPPMDASDLVGAAFLPTDGQASPSDITQSLAKGARMHGARFHEGVRVTGFEFEDERVVAVLTSAGRIACRSVVICAGMWSRQLGRLAGVRVPLLPIQHQYVVTERIEGVTSDLPTLRDPDRRIYFKEEVGGLVMGGYEPDPIPWAEMGVPTPFEFQLLGENWDHFEQHMVEAIARVPALQTAGVKQMINGPESFTPDGNFILGKAPERANVFLGCGFNAFGIASGGGAGWALADWVMKGAAPLDLWPVDPCRFSAAADDAFTRARTLEAYGRHYSVAYPHEEYESARGKLVSPLYGRLKERGAVFGSKLGWERANWFAPKGLAAEDQPSQGRANWFLPVGQEHRACREGVVLFDQSSFAKFEIWGAGAAEAVDRLAAGDLTRPVGRLAYTQFLNERGGVECDVTVARLAADSFFVISGTGFRTRDAAWIAANLPRDGVAFEDVTEAFGTLAIMGPKARQVLAAVTTADLTTFAFPFGHVRQIAVAGRAVRALRVSYVGELGWELHVPVAGLPAVYDALMEAGAAFGIRPAGYRAIESLRLEKAFLAWGAELSPSVNPYEAGLGRLVKLESGRPFIGRQACEAAAAVAVKRMLTGFAVDGEDVVLTGRETILRDGEAVGYLSSGGWGYTARTNIGLGYVRREAGVSKGWLAQGRYELVVAGKVVPARLALAPLYDPRGERMRS